jgi:hypothetical protein
LHIVELVIFHKVAHNYSLGHGFESHEDFVTSHAFQFSSILVEANCKEEEEEEAGPME